MPHISHTRLCHALIRLAGNRDHRGMGDAKGKPLHLQPGEVPAVRNASGWGRLGVETNERGVNRRIATTEVILSPG